MGTIVAAEYLTIDGVMQDPGGVGEIEAGGWSAQFWDEDLANLQSELMFASDALLLGRVTYVGFAAVWPTWRTRRARSPRNELDAQVRRVAHAEGPGVERDADRGRRGRGGRQAQKRLRAVPADLPQRLDRSAAGSTTSSSTGTGS